MLAHRGLRCYSQGFLFRDLVWRNTVDLHLVHGEGPLEASEGLLILSTWNTYPGEVPHGAGSMDSYTPNTRHQIRSLLVCIKQCVPRVPYFTVLYRLPCVTEQSVHAHTPLGIFFVHVFFCTFSCLSVCITVCLYHVYLTGIGGDL